jgi:hypothetical protein
VSAGGSSSDGCTEGCRRAVDDFRDRRGIADPIVDINGCGVYWPKRQDAAVPNLAPLPMHNARPFWSVIVPLYERSEYLTGWLDSVLGQYMGSLRSKMNVQSEHGNLYKKMPVGTIHSAARRYD